MIEKTPTKHTEEWVAKLIELSSDSVYCYDKYLLEEADWKQLAIKMKSLQKHIINYMGGTKDKKNTLE